MKILFLAPYPPYPPRGGGQQRIYQLIRHTARDHDVWLLCFAPSAEAAAALDPLHDHCQIITVPSPQHTIGKRLRTLLMSPLPDMALRGRSPAFQAALDRLLAAVPFDVVQAESIEMAQYGAQRSDRSDRSPLYVYDAFNAEFLLQCRAFWTDLRALRTLPVAPYSFMQWIKLRRYETRLADRFGGALAVSADDAAILQRLAPRLRLGVVPNGVDTSYFQRDSHALPDDPPYVLFTGTLDFRPNIDAISWFVHDVLPLVRAQHRAIRCVVVGRNPTPAVLALADQPGVQIVGEVADVRPWFDRAAAYVVPMRVGGGVRLKLLEALAMEQAIVATPMGAEGIDGFVAGEHALLADQPAAFAAHLVRVIDDRALARRLGVAGRHLVVSRYDWAAIVPHMVELWEGWK